MPGGAGTRRAAIIRQVLLVAICAVVIGTVQAIARHEPVRSPPLTLVFAGLPVSGTLDDAHRAGFRDCFATDAVHLRCRRRSVTVGDAGPFQAAVDLAGSDGEGGFDRLVLWHDRDNHAVYRIADALKRAGWRGCFTERDGWGDQVIYTRPGSPVLASMDLTFYSKRRMRLIPIHVHGNRGCSPG